MQAFLSKVGYTVEPFSNASNALATLRTRSDEFQVLVADLTMPDMSGDQLGLQAARLNGTLRVLLCSGYPFDVHNIPEDVRSRFATLQKPFLPKMLTEAIDRLVNS
jgi:DNA-binding NtrC family response regulator